ncbi:hypothetical protein HG536_0B05490 [Torulaspora globosa]|uniref:TatD related DNase n=1 Tax=Torulaspora globosa TaxID=48254 RepID=A0A7G3ZDU8_9SACH|nr:uncharacterized protein HG536_0B05490 [Torulaspora globosa]QLL31684.1 hypothetical protein HG536_0B05490 [Torulaspora globosa]
MVRWCARAGVICQRAAGVAGEVICEKRYGVRRMCSYYDIGLNLTDPMYRGVYNGKQYHESDVKEVLARASERGVKCALLTGSSLVESRDAVELAHSDELSGSGTQLKYTVGVHPCCVNEFANQDATIDNPSHDEALNQALGRKVWENPQQSHLKLRELYDLIEERLASKDARFGAVGEIGLDYDRFYYSGKEMQRIFFEEQLKLSCLISNPKMPLFLHMRNCCDDFVAIMKKFIDGFQDEEDRFGLASIAGVERPVFYKFDPERMFVTHSFTGSVGDLEKILALSPHSYIGMNGCSLKSEENIDCAEAVPIERLLLETDAPWCDIRRTHSSFRFLTGYEPPYRSVKRDKLSKVSQDDRLKTMVKGRNEPCTMEQVAIVVANVKNIPLKHLVETVWDNSCRVYGGVSTSG